jgi:hypothetical protein
MAKHAFGPASNVKLRGTKTKQVRLASQVDPVDPASILPDSNPLNAATTRKVKLRGTKSK